MEFQTTRSHGRHFRASTAPARGRSQLKAKISSVKGVGVVQVKMSEDQPWQAATVGMVLDQGAEIRTGLRSSVQFVIEPDQVITLDRLGTLKVLQAYLQRNKVTTDLGVKYGRTRYDIESADLEHQSTIRSPGSTLAIRGTDVTYEDQAPWIPTAISRHGRAEFENFRKQMIPFGSKRLTSIAADKNSPAHQAIANTKLDSRGDFAGRSDSEDALTVSLPSSGGIDAVGLKLVQQLARFDGFAPVLIGTLSVPGPLSINLNWGSTAAVPAPTSLDLIVTDPKGEIASIANPTVGKGSFVGTYTGDNRGLNGSGAEQVLWGVLFPGGKYTVEAINRSGDAAQVFITASQGPLNKPIGSYGVSPQPSIILQPGQSFTGTIRTK